MLPNDPSGNTRFVVVELPAARSLAGRVETWIGERREQLWAEAAARYADGERANLPEDLQPDAAAAAETHRRKDDLLEDAIVKLPLEPRTLAEIAALVGLTATSDRAAQVPMRDARRLGAALSGAGWVKRQGRQGTRWHPPETA